MRCHVYKCLVLRHGCNTVVHNSATATYWCGLTNRPGAVIFPRTEHLVSKCPGKYGILHALLSMLC